MLTPDSPAAAQTAEQYKGAGWSAIQSGQYQRAIEEFSKAISLDSNYAYAYASRGAAYYNLKEYKRAIEDFDKAITCNPGDATVYVARGAACYCLRQFQRAVEDYDSAISLRPALADAYAGRGWALLALHKPEEAVDSFNKSVERRSTPSSWDYSGLATAYNFLGQQELADRNDQNSKRCADNPDQSRDIESWHLLAIGDRPIAGAKDRPVAGAMDRPTAGTMDRPTAGTMDRPVAGTMDRPDAGAINRPIADKWALVIGISKFQHPDYNLKYAAKDAQDFYNYLVNEAGFKRDHVVLLLNENATRENIMRAFGSRFLPAVCEPDDLVVVFVSTHGTPSRFDPGHKNYIVAYNTDKDDPYVTGVDMDEINRRLKEGVKSDRALIVMDTCYSGAGVPGAKGSDAAANFDANAIAQGCGHLVISSSSPNERSWESTVTQNGVFTKYLLESLRNNNHKVDVKTAFNYVKDKVAWEVKSAYKVSQTPQLGGDWQGQDLALYVPATKPRTIFDKELLEMMRFWSAGIAPAAATHAAHDYSKSSSKVIHKGK